MSDDLPMGEEANGWRQREKLTNKAIAAHQQGLVPRVAMAISDCFERDFPKFTQQRWDDLTLPAKVSMAKRAEAAMMVLSEVADNLADAYYRQAGEARDPAERTQYIERAYGARIVARAIMPPNGEGR